MLTENHIKEGLSRAYILAVAHRAGFNCSLREFDYGIDGTFHDVKVIGKRRVETGFNIDFQAKASQNCAVSTAGVTYVLSAKNQRDLVETEVGTPRILIVLALPKDSNDWLQTSTDKLVLQRCAWWLSLRGHPPTQNDTASTIKIPLNQSFDVAALTAMMNRVKRGELP